MVPRPKLGGDSIYTMVHPKPRLTSHEGEGNTTSQALAPICLSWVRNIGKQHVDSHVLLEINGWKWMTRHAIDWGKYAKLKPKADLPNHYGVTTTFNVVDLFSNRGSLTRYYSIKSQHTLQSCCVTSLNRGILWFGHGGSCWPYYP